MDTSQEYIKMCEKATEIQKLWKQDCGDFQTESVDDAVNADIMVTDELSDEARQEGDPNCVWLPRQDQLQEMVKDKYQGHAAAIIDEICFDWHQFCFCEKTASDWPWNEPNVTFEQLWFAFVMKEKFNKTWNGEDWV